MKSISEFQSFTLQKISAAKTQLLADAKTPEEVSAAIGETFKLEGDKLRYALAASDLIKDKTSVRRVIIVGFAEGETVPPKYQKVEEDYYLVELVETRPAVQAATSDKRGGPRRGGGNKPSGPKSSPWGMSPEEKAAKNKPAVQTPKA